MANIDGFERVPCTPHIDDSQVDANVFSGLGPEAAAMHEAIFGPGAVKREKDMREMITRERTQQDCEFRLHPIPDPEEAEVVIDWIPDPIEEVICNWHNPRVERWYIFSGERLELHRQIAPGEFVSIDATFFPSRNSLTRTN